MKPKYVPDALEAIPYNFPDLNFKGISFQGVSSHFLLLNSKGSIIRIPQARFYGLKRRLEKRIGYLQNLGESCSPSELEETQRQYSAIENIESQARRSTPSPILKRFSEGELATC